MKASLHSGKKLFSFRSIIQVLLMIVLCGFILYEGRSIFIPLSFGLLISFVIYPVCKWMEQKGVSKVMSIIVSLCALSILFLLFVYVITILFISFTRDWPMISEKLQAAILNVGDYFYHTWNISKDFQKEWTQQLLKNSSVYFFQTLKDFVTTSVISVVFFLLVPVYAFLILYYRHRFVVVLEKIFPNINVREILHLSIRSYFHFIRGMIVVYLIVGVLNSIGLLLLGIPHAILFGFLASILTFVPYVGIIAASLLPITISWVTYNSVLYPLGVIGVFSIVQYLEANIIFPWAVSQQLKLNTLILIIVIFVGGIIWGGAGLVLFIPFAAILKLIADQSPQLEVISQLLGIDEKKQKKK